MVFLYDGLGFRICIYLLIYIYIYILYIYYMSLYDCFFIYDEAALVERFLFFL